MHTVRTTMRPDVEVEADDADYTDLKRQGLLVETTTEPALPPAAKKIPAPPASGTTKEG